jgi:hypothetical protein
MARAARNVTVPLWPLDTALPPLFFPLLIPFRSVIFFDPKVKGVDVPSAENVLL